MPRRNHTLKKVIDIAFHAGVLHHFNIRREDEDSLVLYRSRVGLGIIENPIEQDVAPIGSLECHRELRLIPEGMALDVNGNPRWQ